MDAPLVGTGKRARAERLLDPPLEMSFSNLVVRESGPAKDGVGCALMDEDFAGHRQDANDRAMMLVPHIKREFK
jgi:hypothetical protein